MEPTELIPTVSGCSEQVLIVAGVLLLAVVVIVVVVSMALTTL